MVAQFRNCLFRKRLDCNFSFSGIKSSVKRCVDKLDVNSFQDSVSFQDSSSFQTSNTSQDLDSYQNSPVPGSENIAASFQSTVCTHLANRTERGILYCKQRWPNLSQLVRYYSLLLDNIKCMIVKVYALLIIIAFFYDFICFISFVYG